MFQNIVPRQKNVSGICTFLLRPVRIAKKHSATIFSVLFFADPEFFHVGRAKTVTFLGCCY